MTTDAFMTIRVPRPMLNAVNKLAKKNDRTAAAEVRLAITAHLQAQGKKK